MMQTFAGIEIGGTKLQIVTGDGDGNIFERLRYSVDRELGAQGIRTQIEKAQRVSRARDQALFDPTSSAYEQDLCLGSVFSFPCVGYGNSSQNMPASGLRKSNA